jgi:hypothetical protein
MPAPHGLEQDLLQMLLGAPRFRVRRISEVDREQVTRFRHGLSATVPIT